MATFIDRVCSEFGRVYGRRPREVPMDALLDRLDGSEPAATVALEGVAPA
jgi:hypothetical protein